VSVEDLARTLLECDGPSQDLISPASTSAAIIAVVFLPSCGGASWSWAAGTDAKQAFRRWVLSVTTAVANHQEASCARLGASLFP
jgi:hypothetical protein